MRRSVALICAATHARPALQKLIQYSKYIGYNHSYHTDHSTYACVCLNIVIPGADTGFSKRGGLRPAIRNARGGAVRFRPDTKSGGGGGGAARFRPDTKSRGRGCCPLQARYEKRGGGGGGGGGCCPALQARSKSGKGEGLFSIRGGVTIYERGGCNPQTPPLPLDPPLYTMVWTVALAANRFCHILLRHHHFSQFSIHSTASESVQEFTWNRWR